MGNEQNQTERRNYTHIERQLQEIIDRIDSLSSAFPVVDGKADFDGHRRTHEAAIKAANAEEDFWREMKLDIAKKGMWGLLTLLVGLIMAGVAVKLGLSK